VEGGVRIANMRIYSVLDKKVFHTLEELNIAIKEIVEQHNNTKLTDRPYSRRVLFEELERPVLNPLPGLAFEFKRQHQATISVNGHVCLKEDKHYYSVPYQFIGKKVKLLYTSTHVEIFYKYASLTKHQRERKPYGYTTNIDHLASTHKYMTEWHPQRFIKWAQSIDESVKQFVMCLMENKTHPEQSYKACQWVFGL